MSNSKAIVDVLDFDGTLVRHHEFDTNQEAANLMVTYMGKRFDINYQPIGCRPMCSACVPKNDNDIEDLKLLLDIL